MKIIDTHGILSIEPIKGSCEWYWGSDYTHGDLYEAQELYRDNHPVNCNRLVLVHYPDGRVVEPVKRKAGQYFGRPISYNGKMQLLLADFPKSLLCILQYDDAKDQITTVAALPLTEVEDCYNLLLYHSPLRLTRQAHDGRFQIIWPEKAEFAIEEAEGFYDRKGDRLYFCRWYDEPDYREEIVVRKYPTGEVLEIIPGSWRNMPDGQIWVLR